MFIGRKNELKVLEEAYKTGKFEFYVIYGRRRVGKTALINEFLKNKKSIYFVAIENNFRMNLDNFNAEVGRYMYGDGNNAGFSSFQSALEYLFNLSLNDKMVLAIDEYPYLAKADKSFASVLQMLIDKYKDRSKMKIILCGSSMSYIEDNVLSYKSPLYGRRTGQMMLQPFTFKETCEYLNGCSIMDEALYYGCMGGTPQYLLQIDENRSFEENIKNTFLNPSSFIFEEPSNLLKEELRDTTKYSAVITAIAGGASRMSEISAKSDIPTNECSAILNNLVSLGVILKETPYGEKTSKKTIYSVRDNMFRFWYRFIPENISAISARLTDLVYEKISPLFNPYMGQIFEDICKQYIWERASKNNLPIKIYSLGRWWGSDKRDKKQSEIDIVCGGLDGSCIFCECKWTNEKVGSRVLKKLFYKSEIFDEYTDRFYFLFSKAGFTEDCYNKAVKAKNVSLITYEDIVSELIT